MTEAGHGHRHDRPWRDVADAGDFYRHSDHRVALDIVRQTVQDRSTEIIEACRAELSRPPAL